MTNFHIVCAQTSLNDRFKDVLSSDKNLDAKVAFFNRARHLKNINRETDVIIIDIDEMIDDEGISLIKQTRDAYQHIPIIIYSQSVKKGGQAAIECLSAGASKLIEKKPLTENKFLNESELELIKESLALSKQYQLKKHSSTTSAEDDYKELGLSDSLKHIKSIVIGASTGGIEAIEKIYEAIPEGFSVPIISVLHISDYFAEQLANRLDAICPLTVKVADNGEEVKSGYSYIAPGDYHAKLIEKDDVVSFYLDKSPPVNSCRPSVDVTLEHATRIYQNHLLAVILTGMGQDGLNGCRKVRENSGDIFVQDKATSVVWSMPGLVAKDNLANKISPISELGHDIFNHVANVSSIFNR